jgi:hypothetical protein
LRLAFTSWMTSAKWALTKLTLWVVGMGSSVGQRMIRDSDLQAKDHLGVIAHGWRQRGGIENRREPALFQLRHGLGEE